ncbi:MAG: DUF116 domain-containing protein [Endomicrobiia bacterium]
MIKFIFHYIVLNIYLFFTNFVSYSKKKKLLCWLIEINNKISIKHSKKFFKKILFLLPKCLQNSSCVNSIDNCKLCGRCKIKDIIKIKENLSKNIDVKIKIASGSQIAKLYLKAINPDYTIAVACEEELIAGIRDNFNYAIIGIPNTILEKPCINTDVDIEKVRHYLKKILETTI